MQILRLTTPKLKSVWGLVPRARDEDLSLRAPFAQGDKLVCVMDFRDRTPGIREYWGKHES